MASTAKAIGENMVPVAFRQVEADANSSAAITFETIMFDLGFVDGSDDPDESKIPAGEKVKVAARYAYALVRTAIDIVRGKLKRLEEGPLKSEFFDELKALEALLKRLSKKAGIDEDAPVISDLPFKAETLADH